MLSAYFPRYYGFIFAICFVVTNAVGSSCCNPSSNSCVKDRTMTMLLTLVPLGLGLLLLGFGLFMMPPPRPHKP